MRPLNSAEKPAREILRGHLEEALLLALSRAMPTLGYLECEAITQAVLRGVYATFNRAPRDPLEYQARVLELDPDPE